MAVAEAPVYVGPVYVGPVYVGPVTVAIELIGPAEAEAMLARNDHNRKLKEGEVAKIDRDIRAGAYALNGETIKIALSGRLLDGQNRLTGIVRSGIAVLSVVVRGLPDSAQDTVDIGPKRNLGDILTLHGETNGHGLAAALNLSWRLEVLGNLFRGGGVRDPSNDEVLTYFDENPGIRASMSVGARLGSSVLRYTPSASSGLHFQMSKRNPEKADEFWGALDGGSALEVGNPILTLRSYLIRDLSAPRRMDTVYRAAITIKAWNAWRAGKDLHVIRWVRSGVKLEPFPVIHK
jgi:hypothetical protein